MSILIKGMEMPSCCSDCRLFSDAWCLALGYDWRKAYNRPPDGERLDDCPLVEIPTPHGRLIDEGEVLYKIAKLSLAGEYGQGVEDCWEIVQNAPTIVPAEGGGEDGT